MISSLDSFYFSFCQADGNHLLALSPFLSLSLYLSLTCKLVCSSTVCNSVASRWWWWWCPRLFALLTFIICRLISHCLPFFAFCFLLLMVSMVHRFFFSGSGIHLHRWLLPFDRSLSLFLFFSFTHPFPLALLIGASSSVIRKARKKKRLV